jgi:TP901 family phage tail tape measure protein
MALSAAEMLLVLRASDQASRVVNGVSRSLLQMGNASTAAAARAKAAAAEEALAQAKLNGASKEQIAALEKQAAAYRKQGDEAIRSRQKITQFANTLEQSGRSMAYIGTGLLAVGAIGFAAMYKLVTSSRDYEKQVRLTATQVDGFKASLSDLSKIGLSIAANIAVPLKDVQPALYDIFSSTNANLQQATVLITAFARTAVAGNVSLQDASKGTIGIMNAFSIPLTKVNDVLDKQFQLVRKGVGTYADFNSVIGRAAPSAVKAGQSLDTLDAMLIFLTRNGLSAAMSATSAARALDALSNPKTLTNMKQLGINILDAKGNLLPMVDILRNMQTYLNKFPSNSQKAAELAKMFLGSGGTIQAMRFFNEVLKPGGVQQFSQFLKDMGDSAGAAGRAYKTMGDSVAAKTQLLQNRWQELKMSMGQTLTPVFTRIIGFLADIIKRFQDLPQHTQQSITKILLFGTVFATALGLVLVVAGAIITAVGGIITAVTAIAAAPEIFLAIAGAIALVITAVVGFGAVLYEAWTKHKSFRDGITKDWKDIRDFLANEVWPRFQEFLGWLTDTALPALGTEAAKAFGIVQSAIKDVQKWLKQHRDTVHEAALVWQQFGDQLHYVGDAFQKYVMPFLGNAGLTGLIIMIALLLDSILVFGYFISALVAMSEEQAMLWEAIWKVVKWALDNIWTAIKWLWDHAIVLTFGYLIVLWNIVKSVWTSISDTVKTKAGAILGAVTSLGRIPGMVSGYFGQMKTAIQSHINGALATLRSFPGQAMSFFSGLPNQMYSVGSNMLGQFAAGVKDRIGEALSSLSSAMGQLSALIPKSPAKRGPFSGRGWVTYGGRNTGEAFVSSMVSGITSQIPQLHNALGMAQGAMGSASNFGGPVVPGSSGAGGGGRQINQQVTIYTQEIDPRYHAVQLGHELAARS